MTDRELKELLTDAVARVEPGYALDRIRERTGPTKRRWPYAAGGALVLAVAASVAAFAVVGPGPVPRATDPGSSTSPSDTSSATTTQAVAVYYLGDTPDGLRLYREFRRVPAGDPLNAALSLVFGGKPNDRDYFTGWFPDNFFGAEVVDGVIRVEIGDPELMIEHDPPTEQNAMAIQQVIYTAQAAVQQRLPVRFYFDGNPTSTVFGQPTPEPLVNAPVLDTLALVSLTSPSEGLLVDNDEPFVVDGVGNSFEGNIVTRIQRWEGTAVVAQEPAIAGMGEDRLFPFEVTFDLTDVPPGDYAVISQTDDPSAEGRFHTDTRRITIVD